MYVVISYGRPGMLDLVKQQMSVYILMVNISSAICCRRGTVQVWCVWSHSFSKVDLFVTGERLLECDTVALVSLNQQVELFVTGERWLECDIYSFGLTPPSDQQIKLFVTGERALECDICGFSLTPSTSWIVCYRRETIQVWCVWLQFHSINKFNHPQAQAHWWATVYVWPVWLCLLQLQRCAGPQEETTWLSRSQTTNTSKYFLYL